MSSVNKLEDSLAGLYKGAPHLPENARKTLVQWVPWINLVVGLLTLWMAWGIWHWAHYSAAINSAINYVNSIGAAYGVAPITHRFSVGIWLVLIVSLVEAALLLMAFSPTKDHKKSGWDLMFYVALLNVVAGVVYVFTDYGGVSHLIGEIIGSAIGLYFLFEIRSYYKAQPAKSPSAS